MNRSGVELSVSLLPKMRSDAVICQYFLHSLPCLRTLPQEPSCFCCCWFCLNNNKEEARSLHENCHKFCFTSQNIPGFRTSPPGPTYLFLIPSFALNTHKYERHKNLPLVYSAFVSATQIFFILRAINHSGWARDMPFFCKLGEG